VTPQGLDIVRPLEHVTVEVVEPEPFVGAELRASLVPDSTEHPDVEPIEGFREDASCGRSSG
jgi:hypothetical protein